VNWTNLESYLNFCLKGVIWTFPRILSPSVSFSLPDHVKRWWYPMLKKQGIWDEGFWCGSARFNKKWEKNPLIIIIQNYIRGPTKDFSQTSLCHFTCWRHLALMQRNIDPGHLAQYLHCRDHQQRPPAQQLNRPSYKKLNRRWQMKSLHPPLNSNAGQSKLTRLGTPKDNSWRGERRGTGTWKYIS
jgi:hypothetical protein